MKKVLKYLLIAFCTLALISCKNENTTTKKDTTNTDVADIETNENFENIDEKESKEDEKNKKNDSKQIDSLIENTNYPSELTIEELEWISKITKIINEKDLESINSVLGGSAKDYISNDISIIEAALKPLVISGNIKEIKNITTEKGIDKGENIDIYRVLCSAEKSDIYLLLAKNSNYELVTFQLIIAEALENQVELQDEYEDFVDRAYEILNYVIKGNYEAYKESVKTIAATEEKEIDDLYNLFIDVLSKAGEIKSDEYTVGVQDAKTVFNDDNLDGNIIQVYIRLKTTNINAIDFNCYFDDEMNLISLNFNSY